MRILTACRTPSLHKAQVTPADAQLCSPLKDVLPLTPAVVACSLLMTFVLKRIAARGQPGRPCGGQDGEAELSSQEGPGLGGRKSIAELLTLFDRIN